MGAREGSELRGKRVAVLMTDGGEQVEYTKPREFLERHGAQVTLVSPKSKGEQVANPDQLRLSKESIALIRDFARADKPIAAICHGPWTLIDAGIARGKHVTSWPSLQQDLRNAGAEWSDQPVVVDGKLVTSRKPDDIPAFGNALMEKLAQASATRH